MGTYKRKSNKIAPRVQKRLKRKMSIRKKIDGEATCPRLTIFKSLKYVYAQLIDDVNGATLASASSLEKDYTGSSGKSKDAAVWTGAKVAERALQKGIKKCVFDRNGYAFHGRVKLLADKARETGLQF